MSHLPGAGKRSIIEDFVVHLPTMTEIPNPCLPIRLVKRRAKPFDPLTGLKLPPSHTRTEDWTYMPRPRYPHFSLESCPMRRYCMRIAYNVPKSLARNIRSPEDPDPRVLRYGLPMERFDEERTGLITGKKITLSTQVLIKIGRIHLSRSISTRIHFVEWYRLPQTFT
ncbi:hypothetical protein BgiMline_010649 [Biomphalaria glabrata]|nr:hypothetical protein BgiMline_024367 [Biomphalaria glabrata]